MGVVDDEKNIPYKREHGAMVTTWANNTERERERERERL